MNCVQPFITLVSIRLRDSVLSHISKVEWE